MPSPYVAVPDEALRRRREVSHGAWDLYERYCARRNRDTGRCDPSLTCLAREMERTYCHVADMKTELVKKGWIRRTGRHAVELLVGNFMPTKVQSIEQRGSLRSEKSERDVRKVPNEEPPSFGKNPNEGDASFGKIRTDLRKVPNEESGSPYTEEPLKEPEAAAAAAAASRKWKRETCDAAYVEEVKREGIYPGELVDYVWLKLQATCRRERVRPTKGRLAYWLSTERGTPPVQPTLPLMGAPIVEGQFEPGAQDERLRLPDPNCKACFGVGMEVVKGKGARRCRCRAVEQPEESALDAGREDVTRQAQSG